jgi:hypothetical protein
MFFTTPGYDGWPLVMLRLAEVDAGRLTELVTDAWRMRAPAELAADFDAAADYEASGDFDASGDFEAAGDFEASGG